MKSGNLNFLEPSGPLQACNGTAFMDAKLNKVNNVVKIYSTARSRFTAFLFVRFYFNAMWHGQSMAALIFCRRQQIVISLSCHQSSIWIDYVGDIIAWTIHGYTYLL